MEKSNPKDYILGCICKVLGQDLGPAALLPMQLDSTGLDSLELMEMLNDIEDAYGIRFDDQAIGDGQTVEELIGYVSSRLDSKS